LICDGDSNGAGIVPYDYRMTDFFNAVQWAVGLELFLLISDPWRVFFTTDHPNGAPFTAYPDILALLMDRNLRAEWMSRLPKDALEVTTLSSIAREYSLVDLAIMTRAAPAKLLGLTDRGHLGAGARADVAVYTPNGDKAKMFREAALVFKNGKLVIRDGVALDPLFGRTLRANPDFESAIKVRMRDYYQERYGLSPDFMTVADAAIDRPEPFEIIPCLN
jgi:formylmethanofuran dehydrogenase subunit A